MTRPTAIQAAMKEHFNALIARWKKHNGTLPTAEPDEDAGADLHRSEVDEEGYVQWEPVYLEAPVTSAELAKLEQGLSIQLHPSIHEYFNSAWFLALEGRYQSHSLHFYAVPPKRELNDFCSEWFGYLEAHDRDTTYIPLGMTANGQLVVVENATGRVCLEDYERREYTQIGESLAAVIAELR